MKFLSLFILFTFFFSGSVLADPEASSKQWLSVFHHQAEGKPISGSKEALIDAIRQGAEVRVYLKSKRVEHLSDANFITIFKGEVFAQLDRIKGQKPSRDLAQIDLRPQDYYGLYATNGKFELNWFVRY